MSNPFEKESSTESAPPLVEIPRDTLEHPRIVETPYGKIAFGTDAGIRENANEDRLVVAPTISSYAVIDGMGGENRASETADVLADHIAKAFDGSLMSELKADPHPRGTFSWPHLFANVQARAHREMQQKNLGGAVYLAARLHDKKLEYCMAGDARLVYFKRNGKDPCMTDDEGHGSTVWNGVMARRAGTVKHWTFPLHPNWRFIIASDGLWKFLPTEDVLKLIANKPIEEAIRLLASHSLKAMREHKRGDHRSILIGDVDRVE